MNCPSCGAAAPDGAKFCMECGHKMAASCANCSAELPPNAKFCLECGTKVGAPAAAPTSEPEAPSEALERYIPKELLSRLQSARSTGQMRGERRVVTMLFCDVQGSTAAAEQLDPEEWADIMNGAFGHLISPVYRYEGTLARLMGDAILAFFGAPITHEDDPQRAALAGLAIVDAIEPYRQRIRREWGIDFNVRVGINTGLVVVGEVGNDMRLEYTAMGDEVNLAARMEQTAEPGTVQVSENTYRLIAPLFDVEPRGPIDAKGKSEPVQAFRVLRPKAQPGRLRGVEGIDSPMVGRQREINVLRDRVDAMQRGIGNIVSVVGEAGLGKSRLLAELKREVESRDTPPRWSEGRSVSYETKTPFAAVSTILRDLLELGDGADEDTAAALRTRLGDLVGDRCPECFAPLASLLGLPLTDDELERVRYMQAPILMAARCDAAAEVLEAIAERQPSVIVFEDLHWADSASIAVAKALLPVCERTGLLLVALFRPRREEEAWTFHEESERDFAHRYVALSLRPLDDTQARELVGNLLRIEGIPPSLRAKILAKAEGNPFFVEEVIRSLIDSGAIERDGEIWRATRELDTLAIPDNLATLLNTRLDALADRSKRVAQTAAVIGRTFDLDTLASVYEPLTDLENALSDLQRRGLVRLKAKRPTESYSFKHALTRDAAYESLLLKDRRALHGRVAETLAAIAPDRVAEIANHFVAARQSTRALPWLVEAGDRAAKAYAGDEALAAFGAAIEILENGVQDPPLARRAYEGRGAMQQMLGRIPEAIANFEAMQRYAAEHGDGAMAVSAMNKIGLIRTFMGEVDAATRCLDEADELAEEVGCSPGLAESSMYRCYLYTAIGQFENAHSALERAAELGRSLEDEETRLFGLVHIANTLVEMTDYEAAWPAILEAREAVEEAGNRKYLAEISTFAEPHVHLRNGDLPTMQQVLHRGVEIAEEIGHPAAICTGALLLGGVAEMTGHFEDAMRWNERCLAAANQTGMPFLQSLALCTQGTTYLAISKELHALAQENHAKGLEYAASGAVGAAYGAAVWCEVGFCALKIGKHEAAAELFQRGLTESTAPMFLYRPRLLMGCAYAALAQGDSATAAGHARAAREFAEERKMRHVYPLLAMCDGEVARAAGADEEAVKSYDAAIELMTEGGLLPYLWQCRASAAKSLDTLGRTEEAAQQREAARAIVAEIADRFTDQELRRQHEEQSLRSI